MLGFLQQNLKKKIKKPNLVRSTDDKDPESVSSTGVSVLGMTRTIQGRGDPQRRHVQIHPTTRCRDPAARTQPCGMRRNCEDNSSTASVGKGTDSDDEPREEGTMEVETRRGDSG